MRSRRDPWKWPVTCGATIALLWVLVFGMPRSWLAFLLPARRDLSSQPAATRHRFLRLLPPLVVEVVPEPKQTAPAKTPAPAPPPADPRWWTDGWAVTAVQDTALFRSPNVAAADTAALVLTALGLGADFMTRARPDSVLAARLFTLRLADGFRYDELKPYLTQMARSRTYAAIMAQAADLYGEHLAQEIRVPD